MGTCNIFSFAVPFFKSYNDTGTVARSFLFVFARVNIAADNDETTETRREGVY